MSDKNQRPKPVSSSILSPEEPEQEETQPKGAPRPVKLGASDVDPLGTGARTGGEGGMIMGPGHPIFTEPQAVEGTNPFSSSPATRGDGRAAGNPPSGARYDPIGPFPGTNEPDFDELMPPGRETGRWEMGPDGKPRRIVDSRAQQGEGRKPFGGLPPPRKGPFNGDGSGGIGGGGAPFFG